MNISHVQRVICVVDGEKLTRRSKASSLGKAMAKVMTAVKMTLESCIVTVLNGDFKLFRLLRLQPSLCNKLGSCGDLYMHSCTVKPGGSYG